MVVGESNRYLKTEYNTVVSGAQMSRMWQEIQRDKHIFPFVQFDVVKDGRTSDICSPLDKLIFEVDSPVLAYYFPPNHFNCRTRVRKLRNGVPSKNYTLPDIPTEFKNNAGMCPPAYKKLLSNDKDKNPIRKECGEIFTEENRYIKNTPKEVLDEYYKIYRANLIIEVIEKLKNKKVFIDNLYESDNNEPITFYGKGIRDAINNPVYPKEIYEIKNELVRNIDTILEKSEYLGFSKHKAKGVIKGAHIFIHKTEKANFYLVVRQWNDDNGKKFYSITTNPNVAKNLIK